MKIRLMPTLLTAIISAGLLVGGWFIYRNAADIKPLERIAAGAPGVVDAQPVIGRSDVTIDLKLERDANVRDVYDTIASQGESIIGSRELTLNIEDTNTSKKLEDVWASTLFDVAQAMDLREYAGIPAAMKQVQNRFPGIAANSEMDETNVYITLKDSDSVKHIVLPRTPNPMGVWPNA
ncbi:hypothetical protein [Paenibacillus sp. R14(2021)]|uniref:hypothetical protein n=1 Tax=Paenibacillus sp. R14(2021) TaxID=2859228 RepID=UPI001C61446B|nr:hypothetical protein [Paenibacillus sp. R14(2021)]